MVNFRGFRKFLFYMPSLSGGGAERVWALLASEFARQGHDVLFVVDYEASENESYLDAAVRRITLPPGHARATIGLARLLRQEKPDVSFSGLGVANLKHMLGALATGRHRRAVISFHGFFASENRFLSRMGNHLAPLFTRLCGRAIAVSDGLRDTLIRRYGASATRTVRIYNPVQLAPTPPDIDIRAGILAREPLILFVGRMHQDKDLPTLLRAFARVKHPGARLDLAGDGSQRHAMEQLAQTMGLAARITFSGYLPNPAEAYDRARVLAITSRLESFGNVVAEAMSHGLPVVSTDAVGPAEILDHGRYGAVVPVGDDMAIARALDAALDDPGDPAPRIRRAREFSIDTAAKAYLAVAEAIIAETA
jgi:glycosyltransferase involved in cell wall biosynthesis